MNSFYISMPTAITITLATCLPIIRYYCKHSLPSIWNSTPISTLAGHRIMVLSMAVVQMMVLGVPTKSLYCQMMKRLSLGTNRPLKNQFRLNPRRPNLRNRSTTLCSHRALYQVFASRNRYRHHLQHSKHHRRHLQLLKQLLCHLNHGHHHHHHHDIPLCIP